MITIIFGPPRIGKTALMTKFLNDAIFDHSRNRAMQATINAKNEYEGYNLTIPQHCVSANYEATLKRVGYYPRKVRVIDPNKLGFYNEEEKTHFILPYETFAIMEAQSYYNSRKFASFPEWRSNLFEQHGHNNLTFYLDTQRPGLIDVNIRELSQFIEVRALDVAYDKHGWFKNMSWVCRFFDNCGLVDEYMRSGKKDKGLYEEGVITADYNVFEQYSSWALEPKFYVGHKKDDFDLQYSMQYLFDIEKDKETA